MAYEQTNSGVYGLVNLSDGKVYVGSSVDIPYREKQHLGLLRQGKHYNAHLQRAFLRDGEEMFAFTDLENVRSKFWLRARECAWILRLSSIDPEYGYNLTRDAWSPLTSSLPPEQRSEFFKKVFSRPEVRQRCSISALKRFQDPEKVRLWKESRKRLKTHTRINNTRYQNPLEHQKTAEAARRGHVLYYENYCAGMQRRRRTRLEAYLESPKLCQHCQSPLIPKEGQFLSAVTRLKFCSKECRRLGRGK